MTDDGEGRDPEILHEDGAGDAAAAFEALRATIEAQGAALGTEMTTIRKGVEAAFDQFDKLRSPPDYGADLGRIVQSLGQVVERLAAVEQSPILRQGPEHYARALERSGEGLVRNAAQALERQAATLERAGRQLALHIDGARERQVQRRHLWWIGVGGVLLGAALGATLTLFLPRVLPASVGMAVATTAMGEANRWTAGLTLMQAHNPTRYADFVYADGLVQANADAISACVQAARQSRKDQKCAVTVIAP